MDHFKDCYLYSIKILTKKDYSIFKLKKKLKSKDFSEEKISTTIDYLVEKKFLRENEYIRMRAESLIKKSYSSTYIKQKLLHEELYIEEHEIDEIKVALGLDQQEIIKELIHKKTMSTNNCNRDKALRFLQSKGYSYEEVESCINDVFQSE